MSFQVQKWLKYKSFVVSKCNTGVSNLFLYVTCHSKTALCYEPKRCNRKIVISYIRSGDLFMALWNYFLIVIQPSQFLSAQ
jgi:hypothetical protein